MTLTRSRTRATITRAALGMFVAVALTGCIKMDVDLELDGDQASGSMILAVERSMLDLVGVGPEDFLDELGASSGDVPEGAEARPWEDDDYIGEEYVFEGIDISEFDDPEFIQISYDADTGRYEVNGAMDLTDAATDDPELEDLPAGMMDEILGSFDMSVSITFPGEVTETNGTVDGNTVTWTPVVGETNEIHAVASESGGSSGFPVWLAVVIGLAVLAAVAIAVLLASRKKSDQPAEPQVTPTEG